MKGIGISPDQQARIFEQFTMADATRDANCAGLDLAFARAVLHEMGGRIAIRSVPGGDTTFTVEVPVSPAGPERSSRRDAA